MNPRTPDTFACPRCGFEKKESKGRHCIFCSRPLVDAVSVECGAGPDCRERNGMCANEGSEDQAQANQIVAKLARLDIGLFPSLLVVGEITMGLAMLRALGFDVLAHKLQTRLAQVNVQPTGQGYLTVKAPYNPNFNIALRQATSARWDPAGKVWVVPEYQKVSLWNAIKIGGFKGALVSGPKGLAVA